MNGKDDLVAKAYADIMDFTQLKGKWPVEYANALCNEDLRCNIAHDKYVLKSVC